MARGSLHKKRRGHRKKMRGGNEGGATGYVSNMFGNLEQQLGGMNSGAGNGNTLVPLSQQSPTVLTPATVGGQSGGASKKRRRKSAKKVKAVKQEGTRKFIPTTPSAASLAGGNSQKGGGFIDRALVPFGLFGLQSLWAKMKTRRNTGGKK